MKPKKPTVAMIMYYDWYSDGRGKTIRDIYTRLGYDIRVFCSREHGYEKQRVEGNVQVWNGNAKYMGDDLGVYLISHLLFMLRAGFWLLRQCIVHRPSIIHIHNMPDYLIILSLIGWLFGIRSIWDVRDISPAVWFTKKNPSSLTPGGRMFDALRMVQRLAAKLSNGIICADKNQRKFLIKNGADPESVKVVMNLPLEDAFRWIGPSVEGKTFRMIYHGTIAHRLGIDLVIRAIKRLPEEYADVLYDIIGDGDDKERIYQLIKELGLEDKVKLNGRFIETEKIPHWVRGASFGIVSNRRTFATDNFMLPHKMLEYIRLGIPVVVPKLNIIGQYMNDDEVAFFEPDSAQSIADAIISMQNRDLNRMAQRAVKFYERNGYRQNEKNLDSLLR